MRKLAFLFIMAVCMVGCKSYVALESMPDIDSQKKIPNLNLEVDNNSFAIDAFINPSLLESIIVENFTSQMDRFAENRGSIQCRLVYGNHNNNSIWGMAILSGLTLTSINLLGVPCFWDITTMQIEVSFLDKDKKVLAIYKSKKNKSKQYAAFYYGYSNPETASSAEALKKCLDDVNTQIQYDYNNLIQLYK